jgi:hypothetical protein
VGLTMAERKAVTKEMAGRYRRSSKGERGRMLDELCASPPFDRSIASTVPVRLSPAEGRVDVGALHELQVVT